MAVGKRTIELTKIAAAALADKLGTEIVAIDLSEQLVLNQVFLLVTVALIVKVGIATF